ncbi:MAG: glucosyltransferase domain-containing protein [Lachnospiraceae bacterium]
MRREIDLLVKNKLFSTATLITLLVSYGSMLINPTIGVDDTAWKVYFIDGVSPIMGRWVLYVINKVIPIAVYNPYVVELLSMTAMMLAAILWTACIRRILANSIPIWGYTVFACVFISSPITSEVITYYLSNGLALGFSFTAIALWYWLDAIEQTHLKSFKTLMVSILFLCLALGCFESMLVVYLVSACFFFILKRGEGKGAFIGFGKYFRITILVPVLVMVMRAICIQSVIKLFSLEDQVGVMGYRGLNQFFPWLAEKNPVAEILYIIKEFIVNYYFHAIVYKPILIFVIAMFIIGCYAMYKAIMKRDFLILLAYIAMLLLPFVMAAVEGYATYYRAAQFVVIINAFFVLCIILLLGKKVEVTSYKRVLIFLAMLLLYHQVHEMNVWLKLDQDKYADVERTMSMLAVDVIKEVDESLPICVIGDYEVPEALTESCYVAEWSKKTWLITTAITCLDESMLDSYMTDRGYCFAQTPLLSVIDWGMTAFYGFDRELVKIWATLGYDFVEDGDLEHYSYGQTMIEGGMPVWPEEGSIIEIDGEYILVHIGSR